MSVNALEFFTISRLLPIYLSCYAISLTVRASISIWAIAPPWSRHVVSKTSLYSPDEMCRKNRCPLYSFLHTNLHIPMKNQKGRIISDPALSSCFDTEPEAIYPHFILRILTSIPLVSFSKSTILEVSVSP